MRCKRLCFVDLWSCCYGAGGIKKYVGFVQLAKINMTSHA
jgi:hypothetical protein